MSSVGTDAVWRPGDRTILTFDLAMVAASTQEWCSFDGAERLERAECKALRTSGSCGSHILHWWTFRRARFDRRNYRRCNSFRPPRWQDSAAVAQLGAKSPLASVHKFHASIQRMKRGRLRSAAISAIPPWDSGVSVGVGANTGALGAVASVDDLAVPKCFEIGRNRNSGFGVRRALRARWIAAKVKHHFTSGGRGRKCVGSCASPTVSCHSVADTL